jgi:type I restriction enzyme M protein
MSSPSSALVNKLWNYCNILRDDGLSYRDYVEQLTFLLFPKWRRSARSLRTTKRSSFPKTTHGPHL